MTVLLGFLAAFLSAAILGCLAFAVADWLFREKDITVRVAAGLSLAYWLLAWTFEGLALLDVFHSRAILLLSAISGALMAWRWRRPIADAWNRGGADLRAEASALSKELRGARWVSFGLGAVGIHLVVRMWRTLSTPAFGWDDFTYHLFRAGRWVQTGSLSLEPAPDAWTYYEFFPWGGDLLWAWAMVWGVGDTLVPIVSIALWLAVLVLGYAVVRELEQSRLTALIVGISIAVIPSQVGQIATAYVDNAVLAMVLGASLFLLVLLRSEKPRHSSAAALLVGVCMGLGLLVKMSFLPLAVPAGLIVLGCSLREKRIQTIAAFCAGFSVVVLNLIFNWIHRGSPLYPFEIVDSLAFNQQHSWILSKYGEGATAPELTRAGKALVVNLFELDPFLNLGFLGAVLVVFGLIGSVQLAKTSRGRWFLLWVVMGAALTILSFFSPRNSSMVVWWTLMMGRFLVPSLAGLMVAGSLVRPLLLRGILVPVLVVEYFIYARRGWPPAQILAAIQIGALMTLLVLVMVLLVRWQKRWVSRTLSLIVACGLVFVAIVGVREGYRYEAYRLFAERKLLDFHGAPPVSAWPIWERLNETGPQRVAATAGFDGLTGHNWFRAPLMGAWLQNEVLYLPVTTDGALVSYRDRQALVEAADRHAWLARVQEQDIDRVAALGPANIEHRWMLDLPEIFDIEISMGNDNFLLARVDHNALASHLASER